MLNIGLTGNIAAGKSTVSSLLAELGATIIDADRIVRELQQPGSPVLDKIIYEFGSEFLLADGNLDRARLRNVVAGDPQALARLNAIVHPRVAEERERRLTQAQSDGNLIVVQDIPLLFEVMDPSDFDLVIFVDAPAELRQKRLVTHRGLSPDEAERMIGSQDPADKKRAASGIVFDNGGSVEQLERQVRQAWEDLRKEAASRAMGEAKRLLLVFAHPDDETFGTGGTVARYADAGADVHLWLATAGEAGKLNGERVDPKHVRDVRLQEMAQAADILKISDLHWGDFHDGKLAEEDARGRDAVRKQIRRLKPDAVITFGPDGVTGHKDHIALSSWASNAVEHDPVPSGIHYLTYPDSVSDAFERRLAGRPEDEIAVRLDVRPWRGVKLAAIQAHASQRFPFPLDAPPGDKLLDTEWFAGSGPSGSVATDIFSPSAPA